MDNSFKKLFSEIKEKLSYKKEKAKLEVTVELDALMKKRNVKKADLSRLLGKSNAYITKILRGESNFTIETMVEIADALDSEMVIHFTPKEENTVVWYRGVECAKKRRVLAKASMMVESENLVQETRRVPYHYFNEEENGYPVAA